MSEPRVRTVLDLEWTGVKLERMGIQADGAYLECDRSVMMTL